MFCETLDTFILCFVVLNTAASKNLGLAFGFVFVAGAYGPGAVSGDCSKPAVDIAIDLSTIVKGSG